MQRVFVLDKNKKVLTPGHPARVRQLLKNGRASIIRKVPFTLLLCGRLWEDSVVPSMPVKIEPGSKTTEIALVQSGEKVLWAGELLGYEVREYFLEKWGCKCAFCGAKNIPFEIEHINPKSRGGSNRVSNLTLACTSRNQTKGNQTATEFEYPLIQSKAKHPLKDAAAVNATRWKLWRVLTEFGYPVEVGTGGRTEFNHLKQNLPKTHWLDAACVGRTGQQIYVPAAMTALDIKVTGHGRRQMCLMDRYGFSRTSPKQSSVVRGFRTGDIAYANVPSGKKRGVHRGRIAVRKTGYFRVGTVDGISHKYCSFLQAADGYEYSIKSKGEGIPPRS